MWRFDRIHGSFILGFLRKRGEEIFEVLWSRAENKIENGGWKCCIFFYFDERVELMEVVIFYHQSFWSFFNFFTQVDYDYFSACMLYSLRYCYIDHLHCILLLAIFFFYVALAYNNNLCMYWLFWYFFDNNWIFLPVPIITRIIAYRFCTMLHIRLLIRHFNKRMYVPMGMYDTVQ